MKIFFGIIFFLFLSFSYAQSKVYVSDIQLYPLGFYLGNNDSGDTGGLLLGIDIRFGIYQQKIRLQYSSGQEVSILGSKVDRYNSINILFEKDFYMSKGLSINPYVGLGLDRQFYYLHGGEQLKSILINLPIGFRVVLLPQNRVSFGLQFQGEFNTDNQRYSTAIYLRYNFRKQIP